MIRCVVVSSSPSTEGDLGEIAVTEVPLVGDYVMGPTGGPRQVLRRTWVPSGTDVYVPVLTVGGTP